MQDNQAQSPNISAQNALNAMRMMMPFVDKGISFYLPQEEEKLNGGLRLWIMNRYNEAGEPYAYIQVPFYPWDQQGKEKKGESRVIYENALHQGVLDALDGLKNNAPMLFGVLNNAAMMLGMDIKKAVDFTPKIAEYIEILRKNAPTPDSEVLIQVRTLEGKAFVNVYAKTAGKVSIMTIEGEEAKYWLTDLADRMQKLLQTHINQQPTQ